MSRDPSSFTELLARAYSEHDEAASERLFELAYPRLLRICRGHLNRERRHHSLQPTELVNELYLSLSQKENLEFSSREKFYAFAGTLVYRILVDWARSKGAEKRGGGAILLSLENLDVPDTAVKVDFVELSDALEELREEDPVLVEVVEYRFFAGLSQAEIACVMKISRRTVQRHWDFAKLFLARMLRPGCSEE